MSETPYNRRDLLRWGGAGVVGAVISTTTGSAQEDEQEIAIEDEQTEIRGSTGDLTKIEDWNDLDEIRNDLDGDYVLANNLDENTSGYDEVASASANSGNGFHPIGVFDVGPSFTTSFTGTFDGQENTISDLVISRPDEDRVGLFGVIQDSAEITGLTLTDINVTGSRAVGGLVGRNGANIKNTEVSGNVTGTDLNIGGLVGYNSRSGIIENSTSSVSVKGEDRHVGGLIGNCRGDVESSTANGSVTGEDRRVGGLVGGMKADATVIDSSASGSVKGSGQIGGLVGQNRDATITNSTASGPVTATHDTRAPAGGLAGTNGGTVEHSTASGSVDGFDRTGGLVGTNRGTVEGSTASGSVTAKVVDDRRAPAGGLIGNNNSYGTVKSSIASGSVTTKDDSGDTRVPGGDIRTPAGGLIGNNNGTVSESFAVGAVTGDNNVGGLVGRLGSSYLESDKVAVLRNSYYDNQTTGQTDAVGEIKEGDGTAELRDEVMGLETSQMQGEAAEENMQAFNFETTWQVETDPDNYPILQAIDADHGIPDEEPDEPDKKHESGVDQDVFDAVDQDGDGEVALEELVEANLERVGDPDGEVNGVEVTLEELVEINVWRLS